MKKPALNTNYKLQYAKKKQKKKKLHKIYKEKKNMI